MDNIRFTEAQIKICFLLSLNKPSAFIRATNGKYKINIIKRLEEYRKEKIEKK